MRNDDDDHHHHQVVLLGQISLISPLPTSLYDPSLLAVLRNYIQFLNRADVNKLLLVGLHWNVYTRTSLLLQQCPACFVPLASMFLEMGGKWPYRCCFVGCCFQGLFNISHSILVLFMYHGSDSDKKKG